MVSKPSTGSPIGRRSTGIWLPFGRNLLRSRTNFTIQTDSSRGYESVSKAFVLALPATFSISGKILLMVFELNIPIFNLTFTKTQMMLFQNMFVLEKDYNSAVQILSAGVEFAYMAGANYTKMLFLLSKTMLFLLERKFADANPILHQTGPMIENWLQQNAHQKESVAKQQKEYLQIFFLVLQVSTY